MANADFQHWARKDYWLWYECVALVHGVEPPSTESLPIHQSRHDRLSYERLGDLVQSGCIGGSLKHRGQAGIGAIEPADFVRWLDLKEIEFPAELRAAVERFHPSSAGGEAVQNTGNVSAKNTDRLGADDLDPKREEKFLQVLLAMAIGQYHYQPNRTDHGVANIVDHAKALGLSVSKSWVTERLKDAAEHLPRDWADRRIPKVKILEKDAEK